MEPHRILGTWQISSICVCNHLNKISREVDKYIWHYELLYYTIVVEPDDLVFGRDVFFVDKSALGKSHLICLFQAVMEVLVNVPIFRKHPYICCVRFLLLLHVASTVLCYLSEGLVCVPMAHIGFDHFSLSSLFSSAKMFLAQICTVLELDYLLYMEREIMLIWQRETGCVPTSMDW